jgi:hypothetical protein
MKTRKPTTFGKLRTIRTLGGKTLRIDIENGSYVTIKKTNSAWSVLLNNKILDFEGDFRECVSYAWKVVQWVDCDMFT